MATTSTNKQPLLMDRVLHQVVDLAGRTVEPLNTTNITGANNAALILDCTTNDGAMISDTYTIGRSTEDIPVEAGGPDPYIVNMYLSTANDFLRASQSQFIGFFSTGGYIIDPDGDGETYLDYTLDGEKVRYTEMPVVLAPVPHQGSTDDEQVAGVFFRALYVPKGYVLWAAVQKKTALDTAPQAPLFGIQGGYY